MPDPMHDTRSVPTSPLPPSPAENGMPSMSLAFAVSPDPYNECAGRRANDPGTGQPLERGAVMINRSSAPGWRPLRGSSPAEKLWLNSVVEGGCWRWQGAINASGYGAIWDGERVRPAHRVAFELWIGPIPDGFQVDHVAVRGCVHRDCVNPAHLEAVTPAENLRRAYHLAACCFNGHEFTPENTYRNAEGRRCRACGRARAIRKRERQAAAEGRTLIPRKRRSLAEVEQ